MKRMERINPGETPERLPEAKNNGVRSVYALVVEGSPFHINRGADDLEALKQ